MIDVLVDIGLANTQWRGRGWHTTSLPPLPPAVLARTIVSMSGGARPLVPSRLSPGGVAHGGRRQPTTKAGGYLALAKLRVVELLLITTVPAMVLAEEGWPSTGLVIAVLFGGTLGAAGANAINMIIDRDIDAKMERTSGRPLVTGLISIREAVVFAIVLEVAAFAVLWYWANLLSAVLTFGAMAFYVLVYTIWLKRTSRQNIVIGGAAGAVPVLVGWAAVRGELDWAPLALFVLMFLWTPPHFWALAIRHADEYRAAGVPMLPVVVPVAEAVRSMIGYTVLLVASSLVVIPIADLGWVYAVAAVVAGGVFLGGTVGLVRDPSASRAMRVFAYSITYVTVLFAALMVDVFVRHGV